MKKVLLFASLLLYSIFFCASNYAKSSHAKPKDEPLDQIIAVVNDDVVTKSEFNHAFALVKMQIAQERVAAPPAAFLQKQVLDQLINKKLQLQLAKQAGIQVADADLNKTIQHIAEQNNVSTEMLYQRLTQEGMSISDYRNEMREQLILQKLQQQEVVSRITITPEEVNAFMRTKTWQQDTAKEYHLEDILIPLSETPSSEELLVAKTRADRVVNQLNQGKRLSTILQTESSEDHPLQGNDLGWRGLSEMPSAFSAHIVRMQAKETVGPIQTPNGLHIIHMVAIRPLAGAQQTPSHKQIEDLLMQRKFEEAIQSWVSKLRYQAFISTDLATKA